MDNKNLKHVSSDVLTKVVLGLKKVVLFDHLTDEQTVAMFGEMAENKSASRNIRNIRLDGAGMGKGNQQYLLQL